MNIPITQSKEWQHLQHDLKERSFYQEGPGYQYLAILKHTPAGNYLYLPYGPVVENQKSFDQALASLNALAREHRAIFIRIEPENRELQLPKNAKKVRNLSPAETWVLDLTPDKATILTNFSQGTRTRYNTYAKKGIIVEKTHDPDQIQHLVALQSKLFKIKHLTTYSEHYLKTELKQPFATLYLAKYSAKDDQTLAKAQTSSQNPTSTSVNSSQSPAKPHDGQVLAASLFFDYPISGVNPATSQAPANLTSQTTPGASQAPANPISTRYYMQSAADPDFKKLPATVALLTTALFDAKDQNIKNFDFWGIAPDGAPADHPWKGFTEFKKSFGGHEVKYLGTYDLILHPLKYQIFRALHHLKYGK